MPGTDNVQIAAPEHLKDKANALAYLIDLDEGGDEIFEGEAAHSADGSAPATHVVNRTQLQEHTYEAPHDRRADGDHGPYPNARKRARAGGARLEC